MPVRKDFIPNHFEVNWAKAQLKRLITSAPGLKPRGNRFTFSFFHYTHPLSPEATIPPQQLFPLRPGVSSTDDWYKGPIPANIEVGENTLIDSAYTFERFHSRLQPGLKIGHHVTLWRTSLATEPNARIDIGDYCYLSNVSIACSERVSIGSHVLIAVGVTIADSDFHPLEPAARIADTLAISPLGDKTKRPPIEARPVFIEDDVWIGYNATILKGVRIGAGAVVMPGAVVTTDVPAGWTVAGNPAKRVENS